MLVDELNVQFDRTIDSYRIHPDLVSEHRNHEESIRTGGYANRTLLELVQNAADALAGVDETSMDGAGRVEIVLDTSNRVLYCANSGRPFSKAGLTAMTMAHLSGKRGDEIGRFGLGFKSVLAVSEFPQVLSRSVSFEFNSPTARSELSKVSKTGRYPVLRTATLLDPSTEISSDPVLEELASWATTIVKLPDASNIERLLLEIRDFSSEFLLFVGAVREIRLRVLGDEPFETRHVSRDLGEGRFRIERPDGHDDEWIVASAMHAPSLGARQEVGEAISRERVKVTVAVPARQSRLRIGQFWSYFRLQDRTSSSALFNAPWSVNDDRTNLLDNRYNREILKTLSDLFVPLLTSVRGDDPASHLDYLPARGRAQESHGFADDFLGAHILALTGKGAFIPDSRGVLRNGQELRPLDLGIRFSDRDHAEWSSSPNTGDDVPHSSCYKSNVRISRLRDLLVTAEQPDLDPSSRDVRTALERMPKRGLLSWLREWADGDDYVSAANAFRTVLKYPTLEGIAGAKVIPTTDGLKSLNERSTVFLHDRGLQDIQGAVFIDKDFLAGAGIEKLLRNNGFRDLDPEAVLNARLSMLSSEPSDEEMENLWDAALSVNMLAASNMMSESSAFIKVPTRDGGWAWPRQVLDLEAELPDRVADLLLDRTRCLPAVAHRLGVVQRPVKDYSLEDEFMFDSYMDSILSDLNSSLGPGERRVEDVEFTPGEGPGPFSVLSMLRDAEAPESQRSQWTVGLLALPDRDWIAEDSASGRTYRVESPAKWAIRESGLLPTSRGYRRPGDVVAPSLVRFGALLPLLKATSSAASLLELPDELDDVPPHVFREMLGADYFPTVTDDAVLAEFVLAATRFGFDAEKPSTIPARVRRSVEPFSPSAVYLASSEEEAEILSSRQRPFLRVEPEQVEEFVSIVGCRRFADSFSFSMVVEGQQDFQRVLDVYTGLRAPYGDRLGSAKVARALLIAKRVSTDEGMEDQPRDWHLDGQDLIVQSDADDRRTLEFVNEAFGLGLNNARISEILEVGLAHQLELQRQEAHAIENDADRLELYIGPDDLKEALPTGLWSALKAQGLVDSRTSVAELFLTVYGADSLRMLESLFREAGFTDVPEAWAGLPAAVTWVRKMGFGAEYAGQRNHSRPEEFVVPGAVRLNRLHSYQKKISEDLRTVLTQPSHEGPAQKGMVELPTGAGKTRVATETVLRLFVDEVFTGTILWIAQSAELCEQAVQTFQSVWRYLGDERPLTIGRLWDTNTVHEPDTEASIVVATDAKILAVMDRPDYEWLRTPRAVFIDEAHRAGGSKAYTSILKWLGVDGRSWERPLVGLSATPFKGRAGDHSGTKELAARFGSNRLSLPGDDPYQQLVRLGVLARVRHEVLPSGVEIELNSSEHNALRTSRLIDRNVYERIGRNEKRMRVLVDHILKTIDAHPEWPILVFTPSVLSAQVLAASLRYRKIAAESVSGQTGRQQRRKVIRQFQEGEVQVLANCDLLVQGFDAPGVRALYIARPTFSPSAYIQMAGRGLRGKENGGKEECLIVDVEDNWGALNDFLGYQEYEELWKEQY